MKQMTMHKTGKVNIAYRLNDDSDVKLTVGESWKKFKTFSRISMYDA